MKTLNAKTFVATLAAAAAVTAVAAPAAAQPYERHRYEAQRWDRAHENINQRQRELTRIIEVGARRGDLTRREVFELRSDMRSIAQLEARYRVGGLTVRERAELNRRLDWAERRLASRLDNRTQHYGYGYGYGHRR
jgi:Ni/Co efflux regulator RcnB